ncbi:MAG: 7-cyano-7-deazaguanine synthase [Pseudomonadales bacterium]|nr:7-cyano-7-deazaguanine synthase [Pseudomonadales bacterium]
MPARTVFLCFWPAEVQSRDIFYWRRAVGYSGCIPTAVTFIEAFERLANLTYPRGCGGSGMTIHAPLQHLSRPDIILEGLRWAPRLRATVSCYRKRGQRYLWLVRRCVIASFAAAVMRSTRYTLQKV